jgi:hypothetical protein
MFWLLVLSTVVLGIVVIVFMLMRDPFRTSHARREGSDSASSPAKDDGFTIINMMMQEKLPVQPPPHPATLFLGQNGKEADTFGDTLAQVKETPLLPNKSKAYLRLVEYDNTLEYLLTRRIRKQEKVSLAPPQEFSIELMEKKQPSLEREEKLSGKKG